MVRSTWHNNQIKAVNSEIMKWRICQCRVIVFHVWFYSSVYNLALPITHEVDYLGHCYRSISTGSIFLFFSSWKILYSVRFCVIQSPYFFLYTGYLSIEFISLKIVLVFVFVFVFVNFIIPMYIHWISIICCNISQKQTFDKIV